jgi:diguanylate cyclase (GGDEF)-like protein/PAS domain S-box-containing protein
LIVRLAADPTARRSMPDDDMYARLVELLADCSVLLLDADGRIMSWNRGAERITGYTSEEIIGEHFSILYPPEAIVVGHPEDEAGRARASGHYEAECLRIRRDGTRFWAHATLVAMRSKDGTLEGYGQFTRDLTERMQFEQQSANTYALLRATAQTDALTGASSMAECIRRGQPFCVAMFDLDHFKQVNSQLGHAAGDAVLRRVSTVWRKGLRLGDLLGRYGGEEFALILKDCELTQGVATAERLRIATPPACTCSAGVAAWSPGMTTDELMATAAAALYAAKADGRDRVATAPSGVAEPEVGRELRGLAEDVSDGAGDSAGRVPAEREDRPGLDRVLVAPALALVAESDLGRSPD